MATYKLIQDIEAEDHILGPLTLRQFIFALIAVFLYYLCFLVGKSAPLMLVFFVPPALFFTFFALPLGRDQPTEIWALAKLRFFLKPRRRIWDQSGMKELVTITVPKKIETVRTDGLSQVEVKSRLKALANTIDSRGWAIKNVNLNSYSNPHPLHQGSSDRLIDLSSIPQEVPSYEVQASDDILDEVSNPIAQQFQHMINESTDAHRKQLMSDLNEVRVQQNPQPASNWFMNQPDTNPSAPVVPVQDDAVLTAQLKAQSSNAPRPHLRTLQPTGSTQPAASQIPAANSAKSTPDPAILSLANNNDLNVATLAREANKAKGGDADEVVISLR